MSTPTEPQADAAPPPQSDDAPQADETPQSPPPAAPAPSGPYGYSVDDPVISVSRAAVNLVLVGAAFFLIGLLVGVIGYDRLSASNRAENEALLSAAAATFAAAIPAGAGQQAAAEPTRDPNARYAVDAEGDPFLGAADAPVTIIEFGDFRCGFCRRFFDETLQPLLRDYEGSVRFVYRDYPILGPDSVQSALAAGCAFDQGRFWEFHDRLYADQDLTETAFLRYAEELELDVERFTTCLRDAEHQDEIVEDYQAGVNVGVGGTPTFFINGRILVGAQPLSAFVALIEEEIAAAAESTPPA